VLVRDKEWIASSVRSIRYRTAIDGKKKAEEAARKLGIPRAYGSYEELLQILRLKLSTIRCPIIGTCPGRQSSRSREACALRKADQFNGGGGETLLAARDRTGVKIGEAFMVKTHPQWLRTQELSAPVR